MAGLCYTQPLSNGIFTAREYSLRQSLSVTPLRNLPINKRQKIWPYSIYCKNLNRCTQISVWATNFGPFGGKGAKFSQQLSSRTLFSKIIAENQCEKQNKMSLYQTVDQKLLLSHLLYHRHLYLRNRSALAVNCCIIIIHCLEVSCNEDQITSAQFIFTQLTNYYYDKYAYSPWWHSYIYMYGLIRSFVL